MSSLKQTVPARCNESMSKLLETEIAPTRIAQAQVDMPVALVSGGQTWMVHVDHLNRPIRTTNASKAAVWDAVWAPWGGTHAITGSATLDTRFPSHVRWP